ncbi:MAG: cyclase family protein [Caldilineaceae bacterium]
MAAAPAIVTFVSGASKDAVNATMEMYEINFTEHKSFTIPALDFRGTPTGIDLRKVVETGITPRINTGIAHKRSRRGPSGAGLVRSPMAIFEEALVALCGPLRVLEKEIGRLRDWAGRLPVSESPNLLHRFISQSIPTTHSHGATHGQKIYDLSQPLNQDCSFWPFYPPFEVKYFKRKSEHGVNAQYIQTSNHMGTHLDAPRHFVTNGKTIDQIPLDWLYGPGVIVDLSDLDELDVFTPEMIEERADVQEGDILLINTGWHKYSFLARR